MKYLKIAILVLFCSCMGNKDLIKVNFKHVASSTDKLVTENYSMKLPKGYTLKRYLAGGEPGQSDEYWFKDSSVIYITDFEISLNSDNIKESGNGNKVFEFRMREKADSKDTLVLSGTTKNNLFWKEKLVGKLSIGYLNVSAKNKEQFEICLSSFKKD